MRRYEVLARKADCITCLYPTESGAATVEAAVTAVEEQAPVGFESKNKRTVFIGSSMTKKGTPQSLQIKSQSGNKAKLRREKGHAKSGQQVKDAGRMVRYVTVHITSEAE